jgi:hypothetical protein
MLETVTGSLKYINQIRNNRIPTETTIIDVTAVLIETDLITLISLSDDFQQMQKTLIL